MGTSEEIGWDIIGLYIVCSIISLIIFYHIIKAAVKSAIKDSMPKKLYADMTPAEKLHHLYLTDKINYEEYNTKMNELERISDLN